MKKNKILAQFAPFRLYRRPLLFARAFAIGQRPNRGTGLRPPSSVRVYPPQAILPISKKEGRALERISGIEPSASSDDARKFPWSRYPINIALGLYSILSLFYLFCFDQVTITGRWRFQCFPIENPRLLEDDNTDLYLGSGRLPSSNDDPRMLRMRQTRSVLDRLLSASGLSNLEWNHMIIEPYGECSLPNNR